MKPTTSWMIIPSFYPVIGGSERQAQLLSRQLMLRGWPTSVLTRQVGEGSAEDVVDGIRVHRLFTPRVGKLASFLYVLGGLWYLLWHGRGDIYHAHEIGAPGWLAVLAKYLLGGRAVIKLRTGSNLYNARFGSGIRRWQFRTLLRLADRVVVVSSELKEMVRRLGIPDHRVVRITNTVDTAVFTPAKPEEKAAHRVKLGIPADKTVLLYVGRLHYLKGTDILLRAWASLNSGVRETSHLVIVGDGPQRAEVERLISSFGITDTVTMTGSQESVREYYWSADIFVLPSRTEGMSNALVEAMACGLPVVASNVGGAPDIVRSDWNGVLVDPEDSEQLARELAGLIGASDRWAEFGAKSRETVATAARLETAADSLHSLYTELSR